MPTRTREAKYAGTRNLWKRWSALLAGLATIVLFMHGIAPALQNWGPVRAVHTVVREQGIDATPLFYTESDEFYRVQRYMLDAGRFEPRGP